MRTPVAVALPLVALALAGRAGAAPCARPHADAAYTAAVRHVLASGRDLWGEQLLRSPAGATYAGVARHLRPLLLAGARRAEGRRYLTDSGVYYVPFGRPVSGFGTRMVALHVADGGEILARRVHGPRLTIDVDGERYGSCRSRLSTPRLHDGYLPILETRYVDAAGVRYRQESFSARIWSTRSLVTFVRLTADARDASRAAAITFTPSVRHLQRGPGPALVRGRRTYVYLGAGARYDGTSVTYDVARGARGAVYLAWFVDPHKSDPFALDEATYLRARRGLVRYWSSWLHGAAQLQVPERRVYDAERSLLIQSSVLSWRYSVGNSYQELSVPEISDVAEVMGEYGLPRLDEAILRTAFWRDLGDSANWSMGEHLLASARYWRLYRDDRYLAAHDAELEEYVDRLSQELDASGSGLLQRERFSADIDENVYGLHSQAVVWQGLRAMAAVWARTGRHDLAGRARTASARLGAGLRQAIRESTRRLPDGSLFVPVRLVDGERAYANLTASRAGSYWNLVMPYALASGILPPHRAEADGVLRYLLGHGSRLLGLVRAAAFSLYGEPRFPTSGTDQVYGLEASRFLADNDRPDQLVLSLYGQLAAGMTAGTHVAGEGATVAPVRGEAYRKMFLPPNAGSNAAYLETLRLLLVHEVEGGDGMPHGLELAYATPRAWLEPGKAIVVRRLPTTFGRLSYSLRATQAAVHASLDLPRSRDLRSVRLRLRLPRGARLASVLVDGRSYPFDAATGTVDLSGRRGRVSLLARLRP